MAVPKKVVLMIFSRICVGVPETNSGSIQYPSPGPMRLYVNQPIYQQKNETGDLISRNLSASVASRHQPDAGPDAETPHGPDSLR
jgi:hypothetical protein